MTLIKEFKITNLAGTNGVTQRKLDPKTNIFWGLNGSGKTTLLKILSSAIENDATDLERLPFDAAEVRFYSHSADRDIIRRYKKPPEGHSEAISSGHQKFERRLLRNFTIELDSIESVPSSHEPRRWKSEFVGRSAKGNAASNPYKHTYLSIARHLDPKDSEFLSPHLRDSPDERFVLLLNRVWSRYRSKSLAEIRDVQQQGIAEVLGFIFEGESSEDRLNVPTHPPANDSASEDAYKVVSRFLLDQGISLPLGEEDFKSKYDTNVFNRRVVTLIRGIMDKVEMILEPQKELQLVINEMYSGNKHLLLDANRRVEVENEKESIPLWALSSGEKQLLHILLETLAVEESTIMIDEPELSLHPDWQLGLVESMRRVNPHAQFILASHSPELMVNVEDECVFEL